MEPERTSLYAEAVRLLPLRERVLTLLHYVRQSGVVNMLTEAGLAVLYAQCFGVYCGVLSIRDYDNSDEMWALNDIYTAYIHMPNEDRAVYEDRAAMLPFGHTYLRMLDAYKQFGGQDDAPTVMQPDQALRVSVFVMKWTGQEVHRQRLRKHKETAIWMQDFNRRRIPEPKHAGSDSDAIRYGLAEFEEFIRLEKNRSALVDAVDREHNVIIDLSRVESVQTYGTPCVLCKKTRDYCCWSPLASHQVFCSAFCYKLHTVNTV